MHGKNRRHRSGGSGSWSLSIGRMRERRVDGWAHIAKHCPRGLVLCIPDVNEKTSLHCSKILLVLPQFLRYFLLGFLGIDLAFNVGDGDGVADIGRSGALAPLTVMATVRKCHGFDKPLTEGRHAQPSNAWLMGISCSSQNFLNSW